MQTLTSILIPTDFSDRSRGMLRHARALALRHHARATLLHVVQPVTPAFTGLTPDDTMPLAMPDRWRLQTQEDLEAFGREELAGVDVQRLVTTGDPAQRIVEMAGEVGADLIAMPTHGYGPVRQFLLGSVTAKVLHDAHVPVLTGSQMEQAPATELPFQRILCALDLSPHSEPTLRWAAGLAQSLQARLFLAHALPLPEPGEGTPFDWGTQPETRERARVRLEEMAKRAGHDAAVFVKEGEPVKAIPQLAESLRADLLVIGRSAPEGSLGRLRTHAYGMIRRAGCPVVSV